MYFSSCWQTLKPVAVTCRANDLRLPIPTLCIMSNSYNLYYNMLQHSLENAKVGLYDKSVSHCKQTLLHLMPKYITKIWLTKPFHRISKRKCSPQNWTQQMKRFSRMFENLNYMHSKSFWYTKYVPLSFCWWNNHTTHCFKTTEHTRELNTTNLQQIRQLFMWIWVINPDSALFLSKLH